MEYLVQLAVVCVMRKSRVRPLGLLCDGSSDYLFAVEMAFFFFG